MYSFEEAIEEIIIGQVVFTDDRHSMALYAIQQFRILKEYLPKEYLPKEKHHEMSELIIAFHKDKLTSFDFKIKSAELKNRA